MEVKLVVDHDATTQIAGLIWELVGLNGNGELCDLRLEAANGKSCGKRCK